MKKVVVITGASSGIGKELALLYFQKGYSLLLAGRSKDGFKEFETEKDIKIVLGDIRNQSTIDEIVKIIDADFKRVDILINNAGVSNIQPFELMTSEQLDDVIDTNLKAIIRLTHALYGRFVDQQSGHIIMMNSSAGKQGYANHTLYSASKFGLAGFTQSLRLEAKQYGIRVTSIHPGGVNTSLYKNVKIKPDETQYMNPEKLAEVIVYLSETEGLAPDEIVVNRLTK